MELEIEGPMRLSPDAIATVWRAGALEETKANAHLLAAAPILHAALLVLRAHHCSGECDSSEESDHASVMEIVRFALASARGEP